MRENKVHKHVKQKETEGETSDELLGLVQRKPCDLQAVVWTDGGDGQTVGRMILSPAGDSEGGTGGLWEAEDRGNRVSSVVCILKTQMTPNLNICMHLLVYCKSNAGFVYCTDQ